MKILIYTGYNDSPKYKQMGDISSLNKLQYAQKHGYSFLCDRNYENYQRPISWFKIKRIQELLNKFDWIFWTDADSLIVNPEIKLESFIEMPGKESTTLRIEEQNIETPLSKDGLNSFICSDDELGPCMANFLVRNCPEIHSFLYFVENKTEFENHPWWDQGAAHALWHKHKKWLNLLKVLPKDKLHRAFFDYQDGDFIIHDKFRVENGKILPKFE